MFTHLPFEIRLLIWEMILRQPRIVHINMRYLPDVPAGFLTGSKGSKFECLCSTPIPVLLHLCTETRTLALAHYELTFGRANAPDLRPGRLHTHRFGRSGEEDKMWIESNEAEVAKHAPKIYFNFERDTVVFGRALLPRGEEPGRRKIRACFPYGKHFDFEQLQRIENLALVIDMETRSDSGYVMLHYLNHSVRLGSFQRLKKLYLCLEADDVDPSRGVELVDLRENVKEGEGGEGMVQEFVDKWRIAFKGDGVVVHSEGMEGLRIICKDGLRRRHKLRELLLKKGVSPDEVLKCVWVRGMGGGD